MAHAAHFDMIGQNLVLDKKTYAVSIKGLIKHAKDILFSEQSPKIEKPLNYRLRELSPHMQRDIGMMR